MPKPTVLSSDALVASSATVPVAATSPRGSIRKPHSTPATPVQQMPLQVRLPRHEVRAIKIAAAEREQTISDFMLACFHASMKTSRERP
jgi:hypothetical protein